VFPLQQARNYFLHVMETIKNDGRLISRNPVYYGNPKIPISYGVTFPNINKLEYIQKGLDRVIGEENIFSGMTYILHLRSAVIQQELAFHLL